MANIWIVSLFEPTPVDNTRPMRYMGVADAAIRAGHHITHFSCTFRHSTKIQRYEQNTEISVRERYDLVFIYAEPYQMNISLARLRSHGTFTRNLAREMEERPRPDVVLVALPPLSQADYLVKWGRKNGIPVIVDIIDPWPDVFARLFPAALKPLSRLALSGMYRQLSGILRNCSGLIAISDQYVQWAKGHEPSLRNTGVFYPSVPFEEVQQKVSAAAAAEPRTDARLTLIYAGNLGVAYDIPVILGAAEQLEKARPGRTHFVFAGAGHYQGAITEYQKRLGNVSFLGRIGYDDLMLAYTRADIGLAQYTKGATQSVTYKLFDYLSAGLPVLNSLMSEMAVLIDTNDVGHNNQPGDVDQLATGILRYLDEPGLLLRQKGNALALTAREGDNAVVYARIVDFLLASHKRVGPLAI
jgi:glycosyltransferase involved in cell wall biosynthesis